MGGRGRTPAGGLNPEAVAGVSDFMHALAVGGTGGGSCVHACLLLADAEERRRGMSAGGS
jgi:hypothetical protein